CKVKTVNEVSDEPTLPSPTPATPPPPPQQEHIPSPPQADTAPPSPLPIQQPSHNAEISMTLLNTLLETCNTLTKQDANLEQDKIAQAIEITKLKQRVKSLEKRRQFKYSGLKRLRKVRTAQRVESSANTVMDDQGDASKKREIAKLDADDDVTLEEVDDEVSKDDGETDEAEPAKVKEVIEVVTAANLMTEVVTTAATTPITAALVPKVNAPRRRRGMIIQDPKEAATASVNQVKRKERKDNTVMRYQALKMKLVTEAHAMKNMMEEEVSKRKSKSSEHRAAKKQNIDEEVEELKTHLQIVPNDKDDVYTEAIPLALKMLEEHAAAVEKMKRLL
nr:hypothetical protein [Tanacetum cinerariifolium]